jgi:hypothetical protein
VSEQPLHIRVLKTMLDKGLNRRTIQDELPIGQTLLSMALKGKRIAALERVRAFVDAYPQNGKKAGKKLRSRQVQNS